MRHKKFVLLGALIFWVGSVTCVLTLSSCFRPSEKYSEIVKADLNRQLTKLNDSVSNEDSEILSKVIVIAFHRQKLYTRFLFTAFVLQLGLSHCLLAGFLFLRARL